MIGIIYLVVSVVIAGVTVVALGVIDVPNLEEFLALSGLVLLVGCRRNVSDQSRTFLFAVDYGAFPSASFARGFDGGSREGADTHAGTEAEFDRFLASVRDRCRGSGASVGRRALSRSRRRLWRLV